MQPQQMQQWQNLIMTICAGSFLAAIGGLFKMYAAGIAQAQRNLQVDEKLMEHERKLEANASSIQAVSLTLARIDANVAELLRRHENRAHNQGG